MLKTNRAISHEKEDNSIVQIKHVNPAIKWTADSTQILKKDQHFKNIHVSDPFQVPNRVLKCDTLHCLLMRQTVAVRMCAKIPNH